MKPRVTARWVLAPRAAVVVYLCFRKEYVGFRETGGGLDFRICRTTLSETGDVAAVVQYTDDGRCGVYLCCDGVSVLVQHTDRRHYRDLPSLRTMG